MARTPICPQCQRTSLSAARVGMTESLGLSIVEPNGLRVATPPVRGAGDALDRLFTFATTAAPPPPPDLSAVTVACTNPACGLRMAGPGFLVFWRIAGAPAAKG